MVYEMKTRVGSSQSAAGYAPFETARAAAVTALSRWPESCDDPPAPTDGRLGGFIICNPSWQQQNAVLDRTKHEDEPRGVRDEVRSDVEGSKRWIGR